ncbi:unnamed protein product [Schistocephalus solidus]|uniref:Reverse transcriptase domain-containing protein n=1 Tax=Schistocephalus solidus TaxID=70667 RepID=A0A183SBU8_SCHSO|nr:unnamed protein product [Schistocephalus solidus]
MRSHLYITFENLTKVFDTVTREGLGKLMQKLGFPERFTHMVRQLHDGILMRITDNAVISEALRMANGVKQVCFLAPNLVSLLTPTVTIAPDLHCLPDEWPTP